MQSFLTILALSLATTPLFAQQDSTSVSTKDTIIVETKAYNKVVSKTTTTEILSDGSKQSSTISINLPWVTHYWDDYDGHYSFLYFNFAFASDKNIPLNSVKSWEWGMYPLSGTLLHSDDYRKLLTWGFGFSRTSFKLKDQAPANGQPGFTDQRLRYWSWRLPVSLEFRSEDRRNFITGGVEVEMRHHVRARDYDQALLSDPNYTIVGYNKDIVNPWSCNLLFQAGHDDWGIIGRISLTDLFDKENTTLKAMPFSLGISLGF